MGEIAGMVRGGAFGLEGTGVEGFDVAVVFGVGLEAAGVEDGFGCDELNRRSGSGSRVG